MFGSIPDVLVALDKMHKLERDMKKVAEAASAAAAATAIVSSTSSGAMDVVAAAAPSITEQSSESSLIGTSRAEKRKLEHLARAASGDTKRKASDVGPTVPISEEKVIEFSPTLMVTVSNLPFTFTEAEVIAELSKLAEHPDLLEGVKNNSCSFESK